MLERSRTCYEAALVKLRNQLDSITNKYYNSGIEVPPDVCEKITKLNTDIARIEEVIESITTAILVINTEI